MTPRTASSSSTTRVPDPVLQAGLAELFQLGLVVARVSARLAAVEDRAVDALGEAAGQATLAAISPSASLADAIDAGHQADASDAARLAIAARVASITDTFDKAARAVRRTAALKARLADGRPFHEPDPAPHARAAAPAPRRAPPPPPPSDSERAERGDEPEWGDEIGTRPDGEVVRAICRDLGPAADGRAGVLPPLPAAIRVLREAPGQRPRIVYPSAADPAPEPDT